MAGADVCGAEAEACTPANLAGRIDSAGAMWGELGPGAFGITMLGATDDVIQDPSEGIGGTLEFSLIESTTLAGKYAAPAAAAGEADLSRGAQLRLPRCRADHRPVGRAGGGHLRHPHGVRDRGDRAGRRGDDAAGRQVPLSNELRLSGDDLATAGSTWSLQFDMTGAALLSSPPAQLTGSSDLLAAFRLSYEPDQQHAGEMTAISAVLDFVRGPDRGGRGAARRCRGTIGP